MRDEFKVCVKKHSPGSVEFTFVLSGNSHSFFKFLITRFCLLPLRGWSWR